MNYEITKDGMDILFIKLGALGDVVNTLPLAIRLRKHFNARIHWVTEPLSYPILSRHASIDSVILFDRASWKSSLPEVIHGLRNRHFDLALDLQRIAKSALLCMASRSDRRIGFDRKRCKEMTWIMPFERITPADPSNHMLLQYLEFADHLGVPVSEIRWDIPAGDVPPEALPDDYIVLNIGATKPANRWNARAFASLAGLIAESWGITSVLTGGKEDKAMARDIMAGVKSPVIDLTGRTSVMELIGVISGAKAVVSCDTGPMHLSVALGREVVALFGPANPRRTGPYRGHVIQKTLPCIPCNKKVCSDPVCMDSITPQDVIGELEGVMKQRP